MKKKKMTGSIDTATDWVITFDTRNQQKQFPPHILTTRERPDIVMFSPATKRVILLELTSPAEENIEKWREVKRGKYEKLAENIREGGVWTPVVLTVEIGARGFVSKDTTHVWRRLGLSEKDGRGLTKKVSRCAIRCSHFIWISRNNKSWTSPLAEV